MVADFARRGHVRADEIRLVELIPGSGRSQTSAGCPSFKEVRRPDMMTLLAVALLLFFPLIELNEALFCWNRIF